jgi:phosphomannomutase
LTGIFKAYDIRGVYPDEINEREAHRIGYAFGCYLGSGHLVMGHDMRSSSPALNKAFAEGAQAAGLDVTDIGRSTTPMLYAAIIDGGFNGGAMITASHLEATFNGIKLCRQEAIPLSAADGLPEVEKTYRETAAIPSSKDGAHHRMEFLDRYLELLAAHVEDPQALSIVADAGNGMGGLDTPRLMALFPIYRFHAMYMNPDGRFPHHIPDPALPDTTIELQHRVLAEKADLGIAFDGDCDRCGFIDQEGNRVPADLAIAVLAEYALRKSPGATVLYDLRASRAVPERIRQLGGNPVKTRVGHSFIKEGMRQLDAVFAGELSGHYYYRNAGYIDSGILSMITMLNLLARKDRSISQLISPLRKYAQSGEMNFPATESGPLLQALQQQYSDGRQEHLDGLSVEYPKWWFNLRPSNTEPLVRLVMEADDSPTLQEHQAQLVKIIRQYQDQSGAER